MTLKIVYVVTETDGGIVDVLGVHTDGQEALKAAVERFRSVYGLNPDPYESLDDALQAFNEQGEPEDGPYIDVHPTPFHG
jgi:hypothetical protein